MRKKTLFILSILLVVLTLGVVLSGCGKELSSPRDLCLDNGVFRWSPVEGADGYLIYFNDKETSRFFTWYNYLDMGNDGIQSSLKSGQVNQMWVRAITLDEYGEPDLKSDRSRLDFGYSKKLDTPTRVKFSAETNTLQWKSTINEDVKYIAVLTINGEMKEIELKYTQTAALKASLDSFPGGTYRVYIIARAEGYEDSDPSDSVEVTVDGSANPATDTWTVTFDLNYEDSTPVTVEAEKGGNVSRPENPTRQGYTFVGWYFDSYCLVEAGFTSKNSKFNVTAPTTVYAKWKKVEIKTTPVFVYMENCEELAADIYQGDTLLEEGIAFSKVNGKANWFKANINELTTAIVLDNGTKTDKIAFDKASPYYKNGEWLTSYPLDPTPSSFVSVTINGGQIVNLTKNASPEASNVTLEYSGSFTLSANDSIIITNTDGLEYINYEPDCGFNGVAPYEGEYTVYAKLYDDGSHSVWVTMPDAPVYSDRVVYFYNYDNWSSVSAYAWISDTVNNAKWPGVKMTKVEGHDGWYSITVSGSFSNIQFNNSNNGKQTADLVIDNDKPYFNGYEWTNGFNTYEGPTSVTVYFYNSANWSKVYAYTWPKGGSAPGWPGVLMTKVEGHDGWYSIEVDIAYNMIIFNNGTNQTDDIDMPSGSTLYYNNATGKWQSSF